MEIDTLRPWIEVVSALSALIIGLVAALWAYTKFVLERGLFPPVEFAIECNPVGSQSQKTLLEIILHLKNIGTSVLIASDIRVDVRYLESEHPMELSKEGRRFGRVHFPNSVRSELLRELPSREAPETPPPRGFSLIPHDTFVQAGIDQRYTFPTAVPSSTAFVLIWSSFRYAQSPRALQRGLLWVSRRLGLIQFTLQHVDEPHTTERVFRLDERTE